jgi:hypothetical protein
MRFFIMNMWDFIPTFLFIKLEVHWNRLMIDFEIFGITIVGLFLANTEISMEFLGISFGFSTIPYGISLKPPK